MVEYFSMFLDRVSFFFGYVFYLIVDQFDSLVVIVVGVGDGRFVKGFRSLLIWFIGCGVIKFGDLFFFKFDVDV